MRAKKRLGQNWLRDDYTLEKIVGAADLSMEDEVLEVGPGLGTLTEKLIATGAKVVAVEMDSDLIPYLGNKFVKKDNFELHQADILSYDLSGLAKNYKVVANIPYYLTSNLFRKLLESSNPPGVMVVLIQKEVAARILAKPGQLSLLALSVQYYAKPEFVMDVKKELFEPIPKVDSAVIKITRHDKPVFEADTNLLFRILKAGFAERRKKLRNSLSGGLRITKDEAEAILNEAQINLNARAQELSLVDWKNIYNIVSSRTD